MNRFVIRNQIFGVLNANTESNVFKNRCVEKLITIKPPFVILVFENEHLEYGNK